jgi:hypothetical protein
LIKKGHQIWIANNSALRSKLISLFHSSDLGGHSGVQGTYLRLKKHFCWKGQRQDVDAFVKQCQICQQAKHELSHPAGLLQPLPVPEGEWQDITMDFIEGLPKSDGYDTILVVVDRFSKYAHSIPLHHPFTAPTVAQAIFDNVVKLHSLPKSIVSDRDKVFTAHFWQELFKLMGITLTTSTTYHPQTDGQSERVNQCLEMFLRCAVYQAPKKWKKWLPQAELWYNTSHHSSLQCSPFKALYGYEPHMIPTPATTSTNASVTEWANEREAHNDLLRQHLLQAQNKMKLKADKNRTHREFQVGEQVLLKLQPYVQQSVVSRPFPKLALKYYGPYVVLERVGKAAYKLDLPPYAKVHPVFHVSQLKPFTPKLCTYFLHIAQTPGLGQRECGT